MAWKNRERQRAHAREYMKRRRRKNPIACAKERLHANARYLLDAEFRENKKRRERARHHATYQPVGPRVILCARCNVPVIGQTTKKKYCADCVKALNRESNARWRNRRMQDPDYRRYNNGKKTAYIRRMRRENPEWGKRFNKQVYESKRRRMARDPDYRFRCLIAKRLNDRFRYLTDARVREQAAWRDATNRIMRQFLKNPEPLEQAVLAQLERLGFPASILQERPNARTGNQSRNARCKTRVVSEDELS